MSKKRIIYFIVVLIIAIAALLIIQCRDKKSIFETSFIFNKFEQTHPQFPWDSFDIIFKVHLASKYYVLRFRGENHILEQRKASIQAFYRPVFFALGKYTLRKDG